MEKKREDDGLLTITAEIVSKDQRVCNQNI